MRRTHVIVLSLVGVFLLSPFSSSAASAPFTNTLSPTSITEKSARLNGNVNPNETPDTLYWFEWGISGRSDVYETKHTSLRSGSVLVTTYADVSGLAPETTYFYRQVAENSHGKSTGVTTTFTTKSLPDAAQHAVIVETRAASALGEIKATLNGYVSPHENVLGHWWFEWGKTVTFGQVTPAKDVPRTSAAVQSALTKLEPGTTYYFRIVGEGGVQTHGETLSFTTTGTPTPATDVPSTDLSSEVDRLTRINVLQSQVIMLLLQVIEELKRQLATKGGA